MESENDEKTVSAQHPKFPKYLSKTNADQNSQKCQDYIEHNNFKSNSACTVEISLTPILVLYRKVVGTYRKIFAAYDQKWSKIFEVKILLKAASKKNLLGRTAVII